ncbi:MAG: hypothetical protein J7K82_08860 [Thermoproteales archaeon]|nr:hypothetical protein [Thermoproteales archaeon]
MFLVNHYFVKRFNAPLIIKYCSKCKRILFNNVGFYEPAYYTFDRKPKTGETDIEVRNDVILVELWASNTLIHDYIYHIDGSINPISVPSRYGYFDDTTLFFIPIKNENAYLVGFSVRKARVVKFRIDLKEWYSTAREEYIKKVVSPIAGDRDYIALYNNKYVTLIIIYEYDYEPKKLVPEETNGCIHCARASLFEKLQELQEKLEFKRIQSNLEVAIIEKEIELLFYHRLPFVNVSNHKVSFKYLNAVFGKQEQELSNDLVRFLTTRRAQDNKIITFAYVKASEDIVELEIQHPEHGTIAYKLDKPARFFVFRHVSTRYVE